MGSLYSTLVTTLCTRAIFDAVTLSGRSWGIRPGRVCQPLVLRSGGLSVTGGLPGFVPTWIGPNSDSGKDDAGNPPGRLLERVPRAIHGWRPGHPVVTFLPRARPIPPCAGIHCRLFRQDSATRTDRWPRGSRTRIVKVYGADLEVLPLDDRPEKVGGFLPAPLYQLRRQTRSQYRRNESKEFSRSVIVKRNHAHCRLAGSIRVADVGFEPRLRIMSPAW